MRLILGDCIEVMEKLVKEGINVDMTITSPPYDNLRSYKNSLTWGQGVWQKAIELLYSITISGGVVVWVVNDATIEGSETGNSFRQALYFKEVGFRLHDTMIYAKNNPVPLTHNRYEQQFEYMFIFSKGKPKTFNPIKQPTKYHGQVRKMSYECGSTKEKKSAMRSGTSRVNLTKKEKIKYNIWFYSVGSMLTTKDRIAFQHPAVFPEKLATDHIISWSNEGDTVLDPFMGSGTVGKMCKRLNRDFIGIEIDKEYYEIAKARIKMEIEKGK